jgi:DNA-binding response OmpR family regulator
MHGRSQRGAKASRRATVVLVEEPRSDDWMAKFKVLLADDDPGLRKLVGTTLGTDDFSLYHAADGVETLEVARNEHPDIILLDINMPRKNGLEVLREIRTDPSTAGIKVVMLTASGNDADRAGAVEARADDYFVKPFSPVALLNKIYDLLG